MIFFKKRSEKAKARATQELIQTKEARKKVVGQAITASKKAVKVIENNGFTVKIYLAAGGQTKKGKSHAH